MVERVENTDVRIDWLDVVLLETCREREHSKLVQGMNDLKGQAQEMRKHLYLVEDKMKQMAEKLASQNMSSSLAEDRKIQLLKGPTFSFCLCLPCFLLFAIGPQAPKSYKFAKY